MTALAQVPDSLAGARVVIWGAGIHGGGLAAARWCAREGAEVAILDRHCPSDLQESAATCLAAGWAWHLGQANHPICRRADLIVASPAIPPRQLATLPADAAPVIGADALFFARHRGPRLAVTGTKGKSTTAHILSTLLDWPVGGNSHTPLLDILAQHGTGTPVVCELSSFQLHYLTQAPPQFHAAILTSLGQDHLDWHADLAEYHARKADLMNWAATTYAAEGLRSQFAGADHERYVTCLDGVFRTADGIDIAPRETLALRGHHNTSNACLALSAAMGEQLDPGIAGIRLTSVTGLPHRFENVAVQAERRFINDSIATTAEATIAGLSAIDGPIAVILGGRDKGGSFTDLAKLCQLREIAVVCLAGSPPSLYQAYDEAGVTVQHAVDLAEAVSAAAGAIDHGTVVLSPACASGPPYRDFVERGDHFRKLAAAWRPT